MSNTSQSHLNIKKVCVIGAGVMGQAIASHMINARLKCLLLDMKAPGADPNALVKQSINKIALSKPALLFSKNDLDLIEIGNIDDDLHKVKDCDLIIEAVLEKIETKKSLFSKLEKLVNKDTIIASNTSGLSIKSMMEGIDKSFQERFLVMHFFNPVRYLYLLEIVPGLQTKKEVLEKIINFSEKRLGKGVVIAKDTPNFVSNRIGVFGLIEALRALDEGYSIEELDAVFGPSLGRPKSAIFRTADIVGIDTLIHVAKTSNNTIPPWLSQMVSLGLLGQKSGSGFYKKVGNDILVLDKDTMTYRPKQKVRYESLGAIRNENDLGKRIQIMAESNDKAAELFMKLTLRTAVYAAHCIPEIADDVVTIDNAMKWGFGWEMGPFEMWDAIGLKNSLKYIEQLGLKLPDWVQKKIASGEDRFYTKPNKDWGIALLKTNPSAIIEETTSYSLVDSGLGPVIVEFHSKMNAIEPEMLNGINKALDICEDGKFSALVLANEGANFSVGANILLLYMAATQGLWNEISDMIRLFQKTGQRLRYSPIPTVAAPFQLTFGGGCELSMWCDHVHAQAETYMGLVEMGVGLIPGGGGNIEMLDHTLAGVIDTPTYITENLIQRALETVAMAKVATSAVEAKELLYLRPKDTYSLNRRFLIQEACNIARGMADSGYLPPKKRTFRLGGKNSYSVFDAGLRSMFKGGFISEHDYKIALKIAHIMTGGNTTSYEKVSEDYLLDLEREAFLSLCGEEKTLERISYMLEHNKPLRN